MKSSPTLLFGVVSCLAIAVFYGYLVYQGMQTSQLNELNPNTAQNVTLLLSEQALQDLRDKNLNGPLPITVEPADLGRTNPF